MPLIETESSKTAAVLLSHGFCLSGSRVDGNRVVFEIDVPEGQNDLCQHLIRNCASNRYMNVQVHLGKYEASLKLVRDVIRAHHGEIRK